MGTGGSLSRSTKVSALMKVCESILNCNDHSKIVLFSQWTTYLDLLEVFFREEGIPILRYDGDSGIDRRESIVREFRASKRIRIMMCSIQCGGMGLDLPFADHVILMDLWYNPFLEQQAIDRVHRMGQERPVTVIRFVTRRSIDEDILRIQSRKRTEANYLFPETEEIPTYRTSGTNVHSMFRELSRKVFLLEKK